ncbi:hypothetical protein [Actinophytocola sp.]|uniref:hypothetical protein n=1 Tax=Actinophytocola sp. TaxID=1872138 RepID=UPI002ED5F781
MGLRRVGAVVAVVAAALLAGVTNVSAAPEDRELVPMEGPQSALRTAADTQTPISTFIPMAPVRVLDTRNAGGAVGPNGTRTLDLQGHTPADAVAVVLNLTGTQPTANTFISVFPAGDARPTSSTLNLSPGQTRANAVTVALGLDRKLSLFNLAGNTHLVADLAGYYTQNTETGTLFNTDPPSRALDTREEGGPVGPNGVVNVDLSYLPEHATAVTFNLTGVDATTSTVVTAYPAGVARPLASSLNLSANEIVPNQVTVPIGEDRQVSLHNLFGNVHLVVDVSGYYSTITGSFFFAFTPLRWFDTRDSGNRPLNPNTIIAATGWDPEVTAVAANLTATNPSAPQFLTVWPGGGTQPNASNLNLVAGQTAANAVNVGVGLETDPEVNDYSINFTTNAGTVDVIFDVTGFFVN